MKRLHRKDLFTWSVFNERLDLDFNAFAWIRAGGNVLVDPLPLSAHDEAHLRKLGGAAWIVLTNGDHVRGARELAGRFEAKLVAPARERELLPFACDRWLADGEEIVPGLSSLPLAGSKTPGEIALLLEESTLLFGDLVRGHVAGSLARLPDPKLADRAAALTSLRGLLGHERVDAVLVGDGWSVFRDGRARLEELVAAG